MWLREKEPQNMVINDPKGELLVKNYVPATVRGFQVIQFNLINALKTDIYNPLMMAAQSAIEGNSVATAQYIESIADVFFPLDGGEDPVWPNAANNAFKRAAYGLIDYYLEESEVKRQAMQLAGEKQEVIDTAIDQMWGKVTLYNAYQLFVQLTSKKRKNPTNDLQDRVNDARDKETGEFKPGSEFDGMTPQQFGELKEKTIKMSELWEGNKELDLLTLYFNATSRLPRNSMRTLVSNADNALRAIGGADKMLASIYGIAITAMVRRELSAFLIKVDKRADKSTEGMKEQRLETSALIPQHATKRKFNGVKLGEVGSEMTRVSASYDEDDVNRTNLRRNDNNTVRFSMFIAQNNLNLLQANYTDYNHRRHLSGAKDRLIGTRKGTRAIKDCVETKNNKLIYLC